jgi:hypothetical protein
MSSRVAQWLHRAVLRPIVNINIYIRNQPHPNTNPQKLSLRLSAETCELELFVGKNWSYCIKLTMSLYHEAAAILDTVNKGKTSLKAEIFGKKTWKTDGKVLFALTSEAAKWSSILAEVVEKSGLLKIEKQVRVSLML